MRTAESGGGSDGLHELLLTQEQQEQIWCFCYSPPSPTFLCERLRKKHRPLLHPSPTTRKRGRKKLISFRTPQRGRGRGREEAPSLCFYTGSEIEERRGVSFLPPLSRSIEKRSMFIVQQTQNSFRASLSHTHTLCPGGNKTESPKNLFLKCMQYGAIFR